MLEEAFRAPSSPPPSASHPSGYPLLTSQASPSHDTLARTESDTSRRPFPFDHSATLLAGIQGTRLSPYQQAALLNSLLDQRQSKSQGHCLPLSSVPASTSPSTARLPLVESVLASLPSPASFPPSLLLDPVDDNPSMPLSRLEGLNELPAPLPSTTSSSFIAGLAPNHLNELLNAQTNLDLWASTVFETGSPGFLTPPVPPDPSPSPHESTTNTHQLPEIIAPGNPFDWTILYPQAHGEACATPPSDHYPLSSGLPNLEFPPPSHFPPFAAIPPLDTRVSQTEYTHGNDSSSSRAPSPRPSRPSRSRRASKAPSRQGSEGGQGSDTPSLTARECMTPEEVEEDKRRRNTEASARFRAKKKQRNCALQQTASELRDKVAKLEQEKEALTSQNRWLRDIISEKAQVNPIIKASLSSLVPDLSQ